VKSPHFAEDFQKDLAPSGWEDVLHALARPVIFGAILGFALAILLFTAHCPTIQLQNNVGGSHVASMEVVP
jgi:hypothetical protein